MTGSTKAVSSQIFDLTIYMASKKNRRSYHK